MGVIGNAINISLVRLSGLPSRSPNTESATPPPHLAGTRLQGGPSITLTKLLDEIVNSAIAQDSA